MVSVLLHEELAHPLTRVSSSADLRSRGYCSRFIGEETKNRTMTTTGWPAHSPWSGTVVSFLPEVALPALPVACDVAAVILAV